MNEEVPVEMSLTTDGVIKLVGEILGGIIWGRVVKQATAHEWGGAGGNVADNGWSDQTSGGIIWGHVVKLRHINEEVVAYRSLTTDGVIKLVGETDNGWSEVFGGIIW